MEKKKKINKEFIKVKREVKQLEKIIDIINYFSNKKRENDEKYILEKYNIKKIYEE